jgi:probable rRNA maturation factor
VSLQVHYEIEVPELGPEEAVRILRAAFALGGREPEGVVVVLVDDPRLAELHGRFLDDPSPTDVMAFDLSDEWGGPQAEIYVSVERARAVAASHGSSVERELALYLAHGALHLCGYDDRGQRERARMRRAEAEVLALLGFPEPEGSDASRSGTRASGPEGKSGPRDPFPGRGRPHLGSP